MTDMPSRDSSQPPNTGKPILIVAAGKTFPDLRQQEGDFSDWIDRGLGNGVAVRHIDAPAMQAQAS